MPAELNVTEDVPSEPRVRSGELRPGDLIANKYRLEFVLGEGGMGIVYRATHLELSRRVAIKVVRNELAKNDEVVARMLEEARAAANIRSEHVTRVLDLGRLENGAPFIVFEYLEGQNLASLLEDYGALPPENAVHFVVQVCDALAEAHKSGIVHRDLKPENLFLTRRSDGTPAVKVLDFGISKNLQARDRRAALTNPSKIVGSPYYMSPEQMRAGRLVDARTDIWALGVVLYELCTGRTPFAAVNIPEICTLVLNSEPALPSSVQPDLPHGVEEAILRCLEKDPEDRFQDVAELAAALAPFGPPECVLFAERIVKVMASVSPAADRVVANNGARVTSQPGVAAPAEWNTLRSLSSPFAAPRAALPSSSGSDSHIVSISDRHSLLVPKKARRWPWFVAVGGSLFGVATGALLTAFTPIGSMHNPNFSIAPAAVQTAPPRKPPPKPAPTNRSNVKPLLLKSNSAEDMRRQEFAWMMEEEPLPPEPLPPEPLVKALVVQPVQPKAAASRSAAARRNVASRVVKVPTQPRTEATKTPLNLPAPVAPPVIVESSVATSSSAKAAPPAPAKSTNPWDTRSFGGRR